MVDERRLLEVLTHFAHAIVRDYEVQDTLADLAGAIVEVLGVTGGAVCLADATDRLALVTSHGDEVTALGDAECAAGAGVCHDAYAQLRTVVVDDLTDDTGPWHQTRAHAVGLGLDGIAAVPMHVDGEHVGALLLCWRGEAPGKATLEVAGVLADVATAYLVSTRRQHRSAEHAAQLQHALSHRVVVEQAKGIVAERHGCSIDEALERLRTFARDRNLRLKDVARQVVAGDPPTSP